MNESEIKAKIDSAYKIVHDAKIQEEFLQVEAFKFALGTNVVVAQPKAGGTSSTQPQVEGDDDRISKIAAGLGIDYHVIETLYTVEEGELTLNLSPKLIPSANTPAMKEIAILLAVGRKHAGLGASTPFELIRSACDDNSRLDSKNFAAAMNSLKPKLGLAGKGSKELVPKRPADDLAKELIQKYSATTA
jgi:hypothetical protein